MPETQKILVIRFSALGDLVLTTPIYRELKRVYPQAKITLLTSQGFGSVLDNNPHIDHVVQHPRKELRTQLKSLIERLREEKFNLIYDAHRSLRSLWIVWNLSGFGFQATPEVWSVNKRSWRRSLLIRLKINFLKNSLPQRLHLLRPLQKHTDLVLENHTELFTDSDTIFHIHKFLQNQDLPPKQFIAIGPSASYPLKCWPLNYFRELLEDLLEKNWPLVLVGGQNEKEAAQLEEEFSGERKLRRRVLNMSGKLSPLESAELLRMARLVITNDTSIGHLAEAMRTPALVFFGPTVREFGYAPFLPESKILETSEPLACRPCSRDGRGRCNNPDTLRCLTSITPEKVLAQIPELPPPKY